MKREYTAVTGDLVKSRKLSYRAEVQRKLKATLNRINKELRNRIAVPFSLIRGDEFQGLVNNLITGYEITQEMERSLYPVKVRFGIGMGTLSTDIGNTTAEMDGKCFHRSREALSKIKKLEGGLAFQTDNSLINETVNTILLLIDSIKADWKEIHYKRIREYEGTGSIEKIIQKEGVSYQAVWQTLKKAKYEAVKRGEETIKTLLLDFEGHRLKK